MEFERKRTKKFKDGDSEKKYFLYFKELGSLAVFRNFASLDSDLWEFSHADRFMGLWVWRRLCSL